MLSTWPLIYLEKQYIDRQMYSKQSRRLLVKSQKDACLDNEKKVCFVSFYNEEKKTASGRHTSVLFVYISKPFCHFGVPVPLKNVFHLLHKVFWWIQRISDDWLECNARACCIREVILGPIRSPDVTRLIRHHKFAVTPMEPMLIHLWLNATH